MKVCQVSLFTTTLKFFENLFLNLAGNLIQNIPAALSLKIFWPLLCRSVL